jgi:hypothetical protein
MSRRPEGGGGGGGGDDDDDDDDDDARNNAWQQLLASYMLPASASCASARPRSEQKLLGMSTKD